MDQNEPPISYDEQRMRTVSQQRERREAQVRRNKYILVGVVAAIAAVSAVAGVHSVIGESAERKEAQAVQAAHQPAQGHSSSDQPLSKRQEPSILEQADRLAAMYDYDQAIALLQDHKDYSSNSEMQQKVSQYQADKDSCVSWPLEQVTHVFYHTLIVEPAKSFDGDSKADGYNQVMTTIDEFNKITQTMYERGFVMVSLKDMATVVTDENGNHVMQRGEILLPPGKQPFVLSQDDVSYYHYMEGDGYARKLIVDENGDIKNEYVQDDGTVSVGDYDMVPLIDRFVEQHPDFSYRGAKGIVALTGYNGVLGYFTDNVYKTREDLDENQIKYLNENPDFDYDEEVAQAKKVAKAMHEDGWEFASHTWGHMNVGERSLEDLQVDTQKWLDYVKPIVEPVDTIIFAFGTDICGPEDYTGYDKFEYLKSQGFDYYCNVDSSQYWVQIRDTYLRMGRRNLDGYRMYYHPELLEDLFNAAEVFDAARPVPVAPMS